MIACHALIDSEINNNPLEKTKENKKKRLYTNYHKINNFIII